MKVYEAIAATLQAMRNCECTGNWEWHLKHTGKLEEIVEECLPSGSGFDAGVKVNVDKCTDTKIVLATSFHHMDEHGGYDGWTNHNIIITPEFIGGFYLFVDGEDRNDIREHVGDMIHNCLSETYQPRRPATNSTAASA
jgi:hypothetical protein